MIKSEELEVLIKEAQANNEKAFNKLIIEFKNDLFKIARMRLNCEDDIEDAVQETIIQAYKNIKKIKQPQYFKTWLIKVLINKCNKIYKKSKREKQLQYNDEIITNSYLISENENIKNLDFYILIKSLNYNERISLTLYYLFEFTTKEIGKILNESENTIRSRISRARLKLKKIYEEESDKWII